VALLSLAVKRSGKVITIRSAIALVNAVTVGQSSAGSMGSTTCRPLPPVVLRKPFSPKVSRSLRSTVAASTMVDHGSDSSGSKSMTMRSGRSSAPSREPHGWISSTPICTSDTTAPTSLAIMYVPTPVDSGTSIGCRKAPERLLHVLLVEAVRLVAVGTAHERERAIREMRDDEVADRRVVLGELALGDAVLG
jgi:hypothetical protein